MAGKDANTVLNSPFKFGFFAGLGFFFASILMSGIGAVCLLLFGIGLGALGGLFTGGHTTTDPNVRPVSEHHIIIRSADNQ